MGDTRPVVVYSSPAGGTRHVAQVIRDSLEGSGYIPEVIDLGARDDLSRLASQVSNYASDCCLWIGSPVYAAHAVPHVMRFISQLPSSSGSFAVPFVTWGAVSSGVALHEMASGLDEKGLFSKVSG